MLPSIILGVVLLVAGISFRYVPVRRNCFFGYRTFRSMKNDSNWKYANKAMATFSFVIGLTTVLVGSVLWLSGVTDNQVAVYAALIALLTSIAIVELKLYKFEQKDKGNN